MSLLIHFWTVLQTVLFKNKFKLIYYFVLQNFYEEFLCTHAHNAVKISFLSEFIRLSCSEEFQGISFFL